MDVTNKVKSFSDEFKQLPKNMRIFSLCLKSLYVENAVISSASNITDINEIRNKTREDAMVYVKGIMPMSAHVVRCIQQLFEYYECLDLDQWNDCLPDILKDVTGFQQCCNEVVRMHEDMMVPLKKREDEAKVLSCELHDLNRELEKKKAQLEKDAANLEAWASGLCFVPIVGLIATPLLYNSADGQRAEAVADGRQLNNNEAAIVVVREVLIPALKAFIDGLSAVAGFFDVLKSELITFRSYGSQAVEEKKRLHYVMVKKKAVEVKKSCTEFYAIFPGVRTDLQCIPKGPCDLTIFNKWLIKQHEVIKRTYKETPTEKLKTLLQQCESIEGFEQLAINN